jgi:hypothetical protein
LIISVGKKELTNRLAEFRLSEIKDQGVDAFGQAENSYQQGAKQQYQITETES